MSENKPQKQKRGKTDFPQPPTQVAISIKDVSHKFDNDSARNLNTGYWNYKSDSVKIEQWFWNHIRTVTLKTNHNSPNIPLQGMWNKCFG